MPELPEVEVSRRGLEPFIAGRTVVAAVLRTPRLRNDIPERLTALLPGLHLHAIHRRGKYLLFDFGRGQLLLHLGMSGSLRFVPVGTPAQTHDHADLVFADIVLRLRDPRRFGTLVWHEGTSVESHPLLAVLGIEPLSEAFDGDWLYAATRGRQTPIKPFLMDGHRIVGVGNIYAAESLFRAGISPTRAAGRISRTRCHTLASAVRATLAEAIAAGGSSVRDYVHSDGGAGSFQLNCAVYGRHSLPCPNCGHSIAMLRQAGRTTFHCPHCQR